MTILISTLPVGKVLSYIDNVLLYSKDPNGKEMVRQIGKFLDRVIQSGGKINVAMSELLRTEVKYLGFFMGKNGILMDPKYRQALGEVFPAKITKSTGKVPRNGPILQALPQEPVQWLHRSPSTENSDLLRNASIGNRSLGRIKRSWLESEALAAPKFTRLHKIHS